MSALLHLMMGSGRRKQPVPRTFTSNDTFLVPAGVSTVIMSGYGARGANGTSSQSYIYESKTIYATNRSTGVRQAVSSQRYIVVFSGQSAYCGPELSTPSDPTYSSNQTCYTYDGFFTSPGSPPTTGASATGLGKSFPGSLGNTQQTPTQYTNVPVTGGSNYSIVVPAGGSITITYEI